MYPSMSQEQTLLRDSLSSYLATELPFEERVSLVASGEDEMAGFWRTLAEQMGVIGVGFTEPLGGFGGEALDAAAVMDALGQHLAPLPFIESAVVAGRLLAAVNPAATELASRVIGGETIVALAYAERQARDGWANVLTAATAAPGDGGFVLDGTKIMVHFAPLASHFIVSARTAGAQRDEDGISLFLVKRDTPGVSFYPYRLIDGTPAADLTFVGAQVPAASLIGTEGKAGRLLEDALLHAVAAVCAEAVGVMRALLNKTVAYSRDRKQFGQPIATFQALRHRMADMYVMLEHANSFAEAAAQSFADPGQAKWMVPAAKAYIGKAGEFISYSAMQIHGAIGMMEETPLAHFFKRMKVIQGQYGTTAYHLSKFAAQAGASVPSDRIFASAEHSDAMPAGLFNETTESAAFRGEIRSFIDQNLTGDLRRLAHQEASSFAHAATSNEWQRLLHERGWVAPSWPKEYGGPGWDARQRYIFEWEMAAAGAPRLPNIGVRMVGPVLMKYGTQEQRDEFLPRMLSNEHYWCQGYSESEAGSDLAAVRLRADLDGDHYVLNGSKLWTTFAHYANWIFLLVRTSSEGRPNQGISFMLAPLDLAGITVRPLISLSGEHDVNQVFFDDVRVPASYLVGPLNGGWEIAKYLLEFERGVGHPVPAMIAELAKVRTIARQEETGDGRPLWDDPEFRLRYAQLEIDALGAYLTEQRLVYALPLGQNMGDATASLMKLSWSATVQDIDQLAMEAVGKYAAVDQRHAIGPDATEQGVGPAYALTPTFRFLNDRVLTIAGGSSEIQRSILARVALNI